YDGTQKDPTVVWETAELMPQGEPEVVFEERINAGDYVVTATYNGADNGNFTIVNDTQDFTIEKARIWISFSGRAIRGHEAILRYIIGYSMSDPIPESEDDYIRANLNTVPLETDWTPESPMGQPYYIIVAGHNVAIYEDYDLMPNYVVEWRKAIYYPTKAQIKSIEWSENNYTYNASEQIITAVGIDEFNDRIDLEVTVNKEFVNAAKDYVATAALSEEDAEYYIISYYTATTKNYTIKPAAARVIWSNLSATYDGTQKNPSVAWESAAVIPASNPEVVAAERINAVSYTVTAEYNGADKDNFCLVNSSDNLIIDRSDLTVTITLTESSVTFGDGFDAEISATWHLASEQANNALLSGLISGYSAGDNVGVYTITLDFEKAEDESRRSPETFLDNYRITAINDATLTVNKKVITAEEFSEWVNNGDAVFDGKSVVYDGNVHMIYADINGSACGIITVGEYLVDGNPFDGASAVSEYNVIAVIAPVNGNYTAEGFTLSAILQIYEDDVTTQNPTGGTTTSVGGNSGSGGSSGGGLPSGAGSGFSQDTLMTLFLIIVIIATVFGFIAILVIVKKFRDEIAEK
ncbi:MAG: hypothetical protein IJQ23_04100, partial [Clostridia bacterium]|nr:hypothetical protein [Clostridia bacterium]